MARIITKELAIEIARKLKAQVSSKKGRPHDDYLVFYDGKLIVKFGIRRASEKDKGHDHIPSAIGLSPNESKQFAICKLQYDYWVARMIEKGLIDPPPSSKPGETPKPPPKG